MNKRSLLLHTFIASPVLLCSIGCQQMIRRTDRSVYGLIEDRQQAALGITADADLEEETGALGDTTRMYEFNPRPIDPELPVSFRGTRGTDAREPEGTEPIAESSQAAEALAEEKVVVGKEGDVDEATADELMSRDIYTEAERDNVTVFDLYQTLAYATRHARDLQNAKEDLYLAALDLTLERHLWTPQFVGSVQSTYEDLEEADTFDQTLTTISDIAVTQQLPYGGDVTARVVHNLVRELNAHATNGESAQLILEADIPLLRGAGPSAYESRYAAERELIYAVRIYERFRRSFLVDVATLYFDLQQLKTEIGNTYQSYVSLHEAWEKAEFIERMGRSDTVFDAPRAKSNFRQSEAALVRAKEQYESSLDRFKIFIGMPIATLVDVLDQEEDQQSKTLDNLLPDVEEAAAVEVACRSRLDLLNSADRVDDARRGIIVARNRILPDLDFIADVTANSNPEHLNATTFGTERTSWRAGLNLRMDDRKTERNAYRASLVALRRAERDYDEFTDTVRADVRRALRRIQQQDDLRKIQALNVAENRLRWEAADAQFDLGLTSNQDVVDAENELLDARNNYARAIADYRIAILEFRRDTGTLRVTDDGRWDPSLAVTGP